MARRGEPDPLLLQAVSERLARLLAEDGPRRAAEPTEPAEDETPSTVLPTPEQPVPVPPGSLPPSGEELPAPRRFGRTHLGIVAVVLLLGVLVAAWSLVRARPVALAAPGPTAVVVTEVPAPAGTPLPAPTAPPAPTPPPAPRPAAGPSSPGAAPGAGLVVHVLGAVRRPGLVRLPAPARVQDAIDAAGGFTRAADPGELNLAQLLTDGQQVVIGTRDEPDGEVRGSGGGAAGGGGDPAAGGGGTTVLDLNSADPVQLEELPGVGPVTATRIVAWRDEHGRFSRVEELQEVDGIGPKTYAEIAPHVRV